MADLGSVDWDRGDRRLTDRHRHPQARAKTDRLDARTLAKLLWAGELDGVWTPTRALGAMRRRLARRAQLVRARSRVKNEIHAVLMRCPFRMAHGRARRIPSGWRLSPPA